MRCQEGVYFAPCCHRGDIYIYGKMDVYLGAASACQVGESWRNNHKVIIGVLEGQVNDQPGWVSG